MSFQKVFLKCLILLVIVFSIPRECVADQMTEDQAATLLSQARNLGFQGRNFDALQALLRITKENPMFSRISDVYLELGRLYQQLGDMDAAVVNYRKCAESSPKENQASQALFQAGTVLLSVNRWDDAAEVFDNLLQRFPKSGIANETVFNLASALENAGRTSEAAELLSARYSKAPDRGTSQRLGDTLMDLYLRHRAWNKAVEFQQARIQANPDDRNLVYRLADIYARMGQYRDAVDIYKKDLAANPQNTWLLKKLYDVYTAWGKLDDWIAEITAGINSNTPSRPYFDWLAQIRNAQNDSLGVLRVWEQALEQFPDDIDYLARAADAYLENRWIQQAIETLDRALGLAPGRQDLLMIRGRAYALRGDVDRAEADWKRAIGFNPDISAAWRALGELFFQQTLYDKALEIYQDARSRFRAAEGVVFTRELGAVLEAKLEFAKTLDIYIDELSRNPDKAGWVNERVLDIAARENLIDHALNRLPADLPPDQAGIQVLQLRSDLLIAAHRYQEGFDSLASVCEAVDDHGAMLVNQAQRFIGSGDPNTALLALDVFFRRFRDDYFTPKALLILARLREDSGDYDQALIPLEQLTREYPPAPEAPEALYRLGGMKMKKADWTGARADLETIVNNYPDSLWSDPALMLLARIEISSGRMDLALKRLEALSKSARHGPEAIFLLGEKSMLLGDYNDASFRYYSVADSDPSSPFCNDSLARILILQKLSGKPGDLEYLRKMESEVWARNWTRALGVLDEFLNSGPDPDAKAYFLFRKAQILSMSGDQSGAVSAFQFVADGFPDTFFAPWALVSAAGTMAEQKRFSESFAAYKKVLDSYPDSIFLEQARKGLEQLRPFMTP